jgi:hypothetical protein
VAEVTDPHELAEPSRFWETLGAEHAAELERYGFD